MPRERKQRGRKHAKQRCIHRLNEEARFIESQEQAALFHDRPKNPFGLLTREDERFFSEVFDEFKKNEWPDEDAKEAFVNNVFAEIRGKELKVATSWIGQFLEMLLPLCPTGEIRRIIGVFKRHIVELSRNRFGSYVLERIAGYAGLRISEDLSGTSMEEEGEHTQAKSLESSFVTLVEELLYPEMNELFVDPFASHVYQAVVQTLSGHPKVNVVNKNKRKIAPEDPTTVPTPPSFTALKAKLISYVRGWDQSLLQSLIFDKYAAPLLQLIIESDVPKKPKKKSKSESYTLAEVILFGGGDPNFDSEAHREYIEQLLHDAVGSRILETILRVVSEKAAQLFFDTFIKDKLLEAALHSIANFVVQRSIERLSRPDDVKFVVTTILGNTSQFIEHSKVSIITAVVDLCVRTKILESEAVKAIKTELESKSTAGGANTWNALMSIPDNREAGSEQKPPCPVSRFGALLANSIIHLSNGHQLIVDQLSENDTPSVLFYMTNPATSHVLEALVSAEEAPAISRRKLLNHVLGSVASMSKDPAGSHIIDACWTATRDLRYYREKIAKELVDNAEDVREDFFGRRVWKNWDMDWYVSSRFDWGRGITADGKGFAKRPVVQEKSWKRKKDGRYGPGRDSGRQNL